MNHKKEQAELSDLFLLGRLYYMAAGTISAEESEKTTYLKRQTRFLRKSPRKRPTTTWDISGGHGPTP